VILLIEELKKLLINILNKKIYNTKKEKVDLVLEIIFKIIKNNHIIKLININTTILNTRLSLNLIQDNKVNKTRQFNINNQEIKRHQKIHSVSPIKLIYIIKVFVKNVFNWKN